jgi:outer membrane murein-binding lipoprotein Lpp
MRNGWRAGRATVVAALVAVCALAGCSSSHGDADAHNTTTSTSAATIHSTTPTPSSVASAVLAAYRAEWAAFEQALSTANPSDPALMATMVDPQLQGVKANLLADQRQGIVARGTFTLHPKITEMSATTATIVDCAYSTAELVFAATGKPVPPVTPPENDGVQATLVMSGSTWKVSKEKVRDGSCAPGA